MRNQEQIPDKRTIPEDSTYEDLVSHLEACVERLESGELSLEDAVLEYEFGMKVIERCNQMLDRAELRITELSTETLSSIPDPDSD